MLAAVSASAALSAGVVLSNDGLLNGNGSNSQEESSVANSEFVATSFAFADNVSVKSAVDLDAAKKASEESSKKNQLALAQATKREELLAEINKRRAAIGVSPLELSPELEQSAQVKCDDMVERNYYEHVDPDGRGGLDIAQDSMSRIGYYAENLMKRFMPDNSAESVFDGWFKSDPHRRAALDPKYTHTGFGVCGDFESTTSTNAAYFVEHFFAGV